MMHYIGMVYTGTWYIQGHGMYRDTVHRCCWASVSRHHSGEVRQISYRDHDAWGHSAAEVVIQEPLKCCILLYY